MALVHGVHSSSLPKVFPIKIFMKLLTEQEILGILTVLAIFLGFNLINYFLIYNLMKLFLLISK